MNERIRELADQAKVTVLTTHGMENVVDGCYVISPAQLEKFAELIIRDCAKTARLTPCPYTDTDMLQRLGHTWDMCAFDAGSEILNRFEIK